MEVSLLSHLTNSAIIVYLLQYFKGTRWYKRFTVWLPMEEQHVHVVMSAIGAWATGLGMHWAVEGTSLAGYTITLAIPPLWVLLHAVWDWAQQMALNQLLFEITVKQKAAAPVLTTPVPAVAKGVTVTAPLQPAS